jgi:hypothetical protein
VRRFNRTNITKPSGEFRVVLDPRFKRFNSPRMIRRSRSSPNANKASGGMGRDHSLFEPHNRLSIHVISA